MANQVTIKQSKEVGGIFLASVFNENGQPVLAPWQEFNVGADMVWYPQAAGAPVTHFYIAKGIGPDPYNRFVAYAVLVEFTTETKDATLTLGIDTLTAPDGGSGCNIFKVTAEGVGYKIIKDGVPVSGTQLPTRYA